ncbi:MAG: acyltransferase family protein [Bifidobacteriaceae bacterium]|jgi:fucose 4-O-acetylase-like acetyltransferase|nr:acyltransferase family protein [Bifidobacteriaceae bacterium]
MSAADAMTAESSTKRGPLSQKSASSRAASQSSAQSHKSHLPRLKWVDAFKGLGILLVIVGHTSRIPAVTQFIYSFHMPLFFWLSGYLFTLRPVRTFLRRKSLTLLVPYAFFGVVSWFFWAFVEHNYADSMDTALPVLLNVFIGKAGNTNYQADAPIWFLLCLFLAEAVLLGVVWLARFIAKLSIPEISHSAFVSDEAARPRVQSWRRLLEASVVATFTVAAGVAGALLLNAKLDRWPLALDIVPTAFAFMGVGYLCKMVVMAVKGSEWVRVWHASRLQARIVRQEMHARAAHMAGRIADAQDPLSVVSGIRGLGDSGNTAGVDISARHLAQLKRVIKVVGALILGVGVPVGVGALVDVMLRDHGVHVDLANAVMLKPMYFYIAAIAMILVMVLVAHVVARVVWLRYLGNASLGIMCVHDLAKHEFAEGLASALQMDRADLQRSPAWIAVLCVLILGSSIVVYEVIRRAFPFAMGAAKLGVVVGVVHTGARRLVRAVLARVPLQMMPDSAPSWSSAQRNRSVSSSYQSSLR